MTIKIQNNRVGKFCFPALLLLFQNFVCFSQGLNHSWLLGFTTILDTNTTSTKARLNFDLSNYLLLPEIRKMPFWETQGNISDINGNFLIGSNGCWIMDATKDTMLNGAGLNPGSFANAFCDNTTGLPMPYGNIILPYPGDSNKYILFHQAGNNNAGLLSTELYYSIVDITLNAGLGAVIQKNIIAFQDSLSWGISACKHANGRDWWVVALKDSSTIIYKVLFTPTGIASVTTQNLFFPIPYPGNACQPTFSLDGTKFAYSSGRLGMFPFHDVRIFSFDRCTGMFDTLSYVSKNNEFGFGLAFSGNSKYLYYSAFGKLYQLNTDTANILASDTLIGVYDGYHSPFNATNFWLMYLAANGKIYMTSGGPVIDLHFINYPDSSNIACDFHQHDLHLPCYHVGSVPNHPNYYLGCDTTGGCLPCYTGIEELGKHDYKFSISPNPNNGNFKIIYLLPQNKSGALEIFDVNGRKVYSQNLPQWSTLQFISVPKISDGIYNCILTSGESRASKKIIVLKE